MTRYFKDGDQIFALDQGSVLFRPLIELVAPQPDSAPIQFGKVVKIPPAFFDPMDKPNKAKGKRKYKPRQKKEAVFSPEPVVEKTEQAIAPRLKLTTEQTHKLKKMIRDEVHVDDISKEFGISGSSVYTIRRLMIKSGEMRDPRAKPEPVLNASKLRDEDESEEETIEDKPGANESVGDDVMAHQIRELWAETNDGAARVCQHLKISLSKFNRIITTYKISKPQR